MQFSITKGSFACVIQNNCILYINMPQHPVAYVLDDEVYYADDCKPLETGVARGSVALHALKRGHYPGTTLPGKALQGVRSVGFWDAPARQDWGLDWHRNEGLEITYLASGSLHFSTDEFSGELQNGSLTVTRPWQAHRVGNPWVEASRLYWLILDVSVRRPNQRWAWPGWINLTAQDLRRLTRLLRQNETPVWKANRALHEHWQAIGHTLSEKDSSHAFSRLQVQLSALLLELLSLIEASNPTLDSFLSSAERSVQLFLKRLEKECEFAARCQSVEHMAQMCNLSETRFSQLCHQLVNQSPGRYLNRIRVQHAQRLLRERPELTVTQIGNDCGFNTSQYFATVFRQQQGVSPRQWRQTQSITNV